VFNLLTKDFKLSSRKLLAITIATAGTLAWFFLVEIQLINILNNAMHSVSLSMIGEATFYASGASSAIIGSMVSKKVSRRKLLWFWITLGVFSTLLLFLIQGIAISLIVCVLLGISLGLGFPVCTALLADNTRVEERGRVSAVIMVETFVIVILGVVGTSVFAFGLIGVILLCVVVRSSSYVSLFLDPCSRPSEKPTSWKKIVTNRNYSLYIFPWIMFNVASGLASFVLLGLLQTPNYVSVYNLSVPVRYIGAAAFGLIGGVIADRFGRKQPIIIALVILAVGFAFLGFAPSPTSLFVYRSISGIAWGVLMVVYLSVPGDISVFGSKEKYYALGTAVPLIIYLGLGDIPVALNIRIAPNVLSPVLSVILFASVIPILYATETLPLSKIRERKLKEHIDSVGKLIEESKASH
jgi:MFS family permease